MISRIFNVYDEGSGRAVCHEFKGFDRNFKPNEMNVIVVVLIDGEPDMFVLDDNEQARAEFERYASDESWNNRMVIVGFYKKYM